MFCLVSVFVDKGLFCLGNRDICEINHKVVSFAIPNWTLPIEGNAQLIELSEANVTVHDFEGYTRSINLFPVPKILLRRGSAAAYR